MSKQIPESWDRWEAMRFMGQLISKKEKCFRAHVTSIQLDEWKGYWDVCVNYDRYLTTSRFETPIPTTYFGGIEELTQHMIQYHRDDKINQILDNV